MAMSFALRTVAFFCLFTFAVSEAATTVVVVKDLARVLLLPYGDAKLIGLVKKGEQFKVITKKNDWYNVEYKNTIGWIFQDNVRTEEKSDVRPETASQPVAAAQKPSAGVQTPSAAASPPSLPAAPLPTARQLSLPEIKKPQEKPEISQEKIEARLKKPLSRQKRSQSFTVDLPPVSVMPAEAEKEKTLPVQDETNAGASPRTTAPQQTLPAELSPSAHAPEGTGPAPSSQAKPGAKQPHPALPVFKDTGSVAAQPPQVNGEEVQKYFEILENSVRVLASVNPDAAILGVAHKNDCFMLLFKGQSWCKIRFGNSEGWVERRLGREVESPTMAGNISRIILFSSIGLGVLVIIVLIIIFLTISLRSKGARRIAVRKDLLIIAHAEKELQLSLTDSKTTLSKCFSEIGFKVSYASDMDHAKNLLMHYLPDVIVVDWHLGSNVVQGVESVLTNRSSTMNILVIFYNVPDVQAVPQSHVIPNAHYLGISFSDRDVFKLVTPLIMTESETKSIRRSVESSALGGEIGHGSLIEVMQFIEIGRKTGCLYIVIEKPFGLIYFEQGRLTYAASQSKQGRDAVFEILALKTGRFHFVLDKVSQTKNVNLSTLEILMEWTKTVDEAHRA
jgi:uncharacterized protein YraI